MASHHMTKIRCQRWILASFLFYTFTFAQSAGTDAPGSSNSGPSSTNPSAASENEAGSGGGGTGLPKSTQIIIGVVVSVIVVIAIAIGVYFFIRKKKDWDRREKTYEAINALRSDPNYQMKVRKFQEPSSRKYRRGSSSRRQKASKMRREDLQPVLPTYDPSSFHRPLSSIESMSNVPLSSIHISSANPGHSSYISANLPPPPAPGTAANHYRSSSDFSPGLPPPPPMANFSRMSGDGMTRPGPVHRSTKSDSTAAKTNRATAEDKSSERPQKPKPVLTKLITNL